MRTLLVSFISMDLVSMQTEIRLDNFICQEMCHRDEYKVFLDLYSLNFLKIEYENLGIQCFYNLLPFSLSN